MNETSAKEWLNKSWHHLSSAKLLFEADHYRDVVAVEIHYASEIALKSILAFENNKIIKTHDLINIYKLVHNKITLTDDELNILDIISEYHIGESYPTPDRNIPSKKEIEEVLDFTIELFNKICTVLNINKDEVKH